MRLITVSAAAALVVSSSVVAESVSTAQLSVVEGGARECTLCLEHAASQTQCEASDSSETNFDFECLCLKTAFRIITRGCSGFCEGTQYSLESQCRLDNGTPRNAIDRRAAFVEGDARSCNLCLEQAARQTYCVNNNSSISGYDFHCLCKEPGFSEYTEGCTDFCRATEYDIEIQCSKIRECPVCNIDEVRKCERCLEDTSSTTTATTSCNLAPDADISGLFESANIEFTAAACTEFCIAILEAQCSLSQMTLSPRTAQLQTSNPGFGFCGPKGTNCKSTESAHSSSSSSSSHHSPPSPPIKPLMNRKQQQQQHQHQHHKDHKHSRSANWPHHSGAQTASGIFGFCGVSGSNCRAEENKQQQQQQETTTSTTSSSSDATVTTMTAMTTMMAIQIPSSRTAATTATTATATATPVIHPTSKNPKTTTTTTNPISNETNSPSPQNRRQRRRTRNLRA
ncbi:uncharacterized protein SEPMUDRAFT_136827 [Sphaerulina musiva SO2202]|uniref:Extracellular membrane protein CFEM domain-containing protein n=1 Tax=Sphaerulina musiva (strain SO2202) TaxID=692275 RepID=M3BP97_SPHMS|nr:uncharacterized protein SEPMUDRAFT_136827 [Sphaerulina musiva SO2202]EMF07988.1 hypothetical protein SEPMUDRAFT_136827 [Sphaerulina musiva SO2202]